MKNFFKINPIDKKSPKQSNAALMRFLASRRESRETDSAPSRIERRADDHNSTIISAYGVWRCDSIALGLTVWR
jgi:hypothetical protein